MSDVNPSDNSIESGTEAKELPVRKDDQFIGELEVMDLTPIKNETFLVGVASGDREKGKLLSTTIKGPYSFYEMIEEVGHMWVQHQHHAAVHIANKDRDKRNKHLDRNTVDYIEAHYADLITTGFLEGAFDEDNQSDIDYTCAVGINEADANGDPRITEDDSEQTASS